MLLSGIMREHADVFFVSSARQCEIFNWKEFTIYTDLRWECLRQYYIYYISGGNKFSRVRKT